MIETTDHEEIRQWAERYGGRPQVYDNPSAGSDNPGIRIDFRGPADDAFSPSPNAPRDTEWDEFFRLFEEMDLIALLFEEDEMRGEEVEDRSRLYRFGKRPHT